MNTLALRLAASSLLPGDTAASRCAYLLYGKNGQAERSGCAPLADLAGLIAAAQSVTVLLAAADVSVFELAVPPLSPGRLRAALPNLVEEKILGDLSGNVIACSGRASNGMRSVAVARRAPLETLAQTLRSLGARRLRILPELGCFVPVQSCACASLMETGGNLALALRTGDSQGLGVSLQAAALHTTLRALVPAGRIMLSVQADDLARYQAMMAQDAQIEVTADHPGLWRLADDAPDLAQSLGGPARAARDWRPWRTSIALLAAVLALNVFALNMDWWRMRQEAAALNASMKRIYLAAYPHETVILDPLLQMRQKIAAAQGGDDAFSTLAAGFGRAWSDTQPAAAIAGMEFHDQVLTVRLRAPAPADTLKAALSARDIAIEARDDNTTWQLRSAR